MLSRVIPLEYLKERDLMFWLPPGGQDNEVWADTWVILADLEPADAEPILSALREADVGAYIASQRGRPGAPTAGVQLYVDREQHNRATDVVMTFLRGKDHPVAPVARKRSTPQVRAPRDLPAAVRILVMVLKFAAAAGLIALVMFLAYRYGPSRFPGVHGHHPAPEPTGHRMTQPAWGDPGPAPIGRRQ